MMQAMWMCLMFNEDDNLVVINENNHEQEDCDNDLSHLSDCSSPHPQKYSMEKGKFFTILPQSTIEYMVVKNVKLHSNKEKGMKIQYLQVYHQNVLY